MKTADEAITTLERFRNSFLTFEQAANRLNIAMQGLARSIPPSNPAVGERWLNTATGERFDYDGTRWVRVSPERQEPTG